MPIEQIATRPTNVKDLVEVRTTLPMPFEPKDQGSRKVIADYFSLYSRLEERALFVHIEGLLDHALSLKYAMPMVWNLADQEPLREKINRFLNPKEGDDFNFDPENPGTHIRFLPALKLVFPDLFKSVDFDKKKFREYFEDKEHAIFSSVGEAVIGRSSGILGWYRDFIKYAILLPDDQELIDKAALWRKQSFDDAFKYELKHTGLNGFQPFSGLAGMKLIFPQKFGEIDLAENREKWKTKHIELESNLTDYIYWAFNMTILLEDAKLDNGNLTVNEGIPERIKTPLPKVREF